MVPMVSRLKTRLQKFAAKKRNLYMTAGGVLLVILIIGFAFTGDDEAESAKVIRSFVKTAMTNYDPQVGLRFTAGTARQFVEKDTAKIQTAKAKGFRAQLQQDPIIRIIEQKPGVIRSNVLLFTIEQKPGEPEKEFAHLLEVHTQKVGGNWRIAKAENTYTVQYGGPGASVVLQNAPPGAQQKAIQQQVQQQQLPSQAATAKTQGSQPAKAPATGQVQSPVPGVPLAGQQQGR